MWQRMGKGYRGLLKSPRDRHLSSLKVMDRLCLGGDKQKGVPREKL